MKLLRLLPFPPPLFQFLCPRNSVFLFFLYLVLHCPLFMLLVLLVPSLNPLPGLTPQNLPSTLPFLLLPLLPLLLHLCIPNPNDTKTGQAWVLQGRRLERYCRTYSTPVLQPILHMYHISHHF
ncbi:MAG: hypothetical protein NXY57DRAFT_1030743 [Lentinula lateritia]|nr:MAG: hypothetical protein NXY57DRAFT_1030743 [Lentinula lateritia]